MLVFVGSLKVVIVFAKNIWKGQRSSSNNEKLVSNNSKILYQRNTHMALYECGILDDEHVGKVTRTKEEPVSSRNPYEANLSDELNDETAQNGALRKEEHTKYKVK